jgi:hypothetical protein
MTIPIMYMPFPLSSYRYIHVQTASSCVWPVAQARCDLTHPLAKAITLDTNLAPNSA